MDAMDCLWTHLHGLVPLQEQSALKVLAELLDLETVDLTRTEPDWALLAALPPRLIRRYRVIPLGRTRDHVRVATADPFDFAAFDALRGILGTPIEPVLAAPAGIRMTIRNYSRSPRR